MLSRVPIMLLYTLTSHRHFPPCLAMNTAPLRYQCKGTADYRKLVVVVKIGRGTASVRWLGRLPCRTILRQPRVCLLIVSNRARSLPGGCYCLIELATDENTVLALDPISRIVPTTMTRITASITAYSAMSCPSFS